MTIARLDKRSLTWPQLELIWKFCEHVAEVAFEQGPTAAAKHHTPAAFRLWCLDYNADAKLNGRDIFTPKAR